MRRWPLPVVLLLLPGACAEALPPPRIVPAYDGLGGSPAPGHGRVVLDVEGRRCRVTRSRTLHADTGIRVLQPAPPEGASILGVTPFELELGVGWHRLSFCGAPAVPVEVRRLTTVFRVGWTDAGPGASVQWALPRAPAPIRPAGEAGGSGGGTGVRASSTGPERERPD